MRRGTDSPWRTVWRRLAFATLSSPSPPPMGSATNTQRDERIDAIHAVLVDAVHHLLPYRDSDAPNIPSRRPAEATMSIGKVQDFEETIGMIRARG